MTKGELKGGRQGEQSGGGEDGVQVVVAQVRFAGVPRLSHGQKHSVLRLQRVHTLQYPKTQNESERMCLKPP